ncbi:MAG: hypothetical protein FJ267_04850, partial [Planctomycetes bacterium]|nr:hypothetical protein [Planctomycetota bacterium]
MSTITDRLVLPSSLTDQLDQFRRRVWRIKSIEAACGAFFGILASYLIVFCLDRITETPMWVRLAVFVVAIAGCAFVPIYLHRWIWCHRRAEQLARLLSRKHPSLGDQLLGIIELVKSDSEQSRSRALCEAAIRQVADEAGHRDFNDAVPRSRHRLWAWVAGVPAVVAVFLLCLFPAAAANAWYRFLAPWHETPRYTFAAIEKLPERLVVPHGEPVSIAVKLKDDSRWSPSQGRARMGHQATVSTKLNEGAYNFSFPSMIDSSPLRVHIGDALQKVKVEPMLRPELAEMMATIRLPEYLQRSGSTNRDIRGGTITLVKGSSVTFAARSNRNLTTAWWGEKDQLASASPVTISPPHDNVNSPAISIDDSIKWAVDWQDEFGLKGLEPFTISITAKDDEAPSVYCDELPRQKVVIDSETLSFTVRSHDDFGVKVVGMEWSAAEKSLATKSSKGERILGVGGSDKESLELAGTFCAKTLGIEPQPLLVRLFVEDYFPERQRSYTSPYLLYVLSAEQHAVWITEQLSKWHRQSLEVRDREMQLHHTNQQLRMLSDDELDQPDNRKRVESQSAAERANGRRLSGLVNNGEDLVRQAMKNPDFGV